MPKLSELRGTNRNQQSQLFAGGGANNNEQLGQIRSAAAYPRPIEGLYRGEPVKVIMAGDIVGMSPSVQIVDEGGRIDWVSSEEVQITQHEFLPQSRQVLNQLLQTAGLTR